MSVSIRWECDQSEGAGGTIARTATSYMAVLREVGGLGTGNSIKHITDRRKWIFKEMKCVNGCVCAWVCVGWWGTKGVWRREREQEENWFKNIAILWRILRQRAKTSYGWKEKKAERKERKQMEELKVGRNGSFAQVGWMDGWLGRWWKISLSFILPPSSNDVAVDLRCLSSAGQSPHMDVQRQILPWFYISRGPSCVFIMFKKGNGIFFIGKPVWTYGSHHSRLRTWGGCKIMQAMRRWRAEERMAQEGFMVALLLLQGQ